MKLQTKTKIEEKTPQKECVQRKSKPPIIGQLKCKKDDLIKGTTQTSFHIITDNSKNPIHHVNIDTDIDIIYYTKRLCLAYILPRLNIVLLLMLTLAACLVFGSSNERIYTLERNLGKMNEQLAIYTELYQEVQQDFEKLSQCYHDLLRRSNRNGHNMVERDVLSTMRSEEDDINLSPALPESLEEDFVTDLENSKENNNDTNFDNSYAGQRTGRLKRSHGRGNKVGQTGKQLQNGSNKNKNKKNRARREGKGVLAVHYNGGIPDTDDIRDGGLIAPWFLNESNAGPYTLRPNLREGEGVVEILEPGLYYIYAQVYYLTGQTLNSFTIVLRQKDKREIPLSICSTNASIRTPNGKSEVSCFTAVVRNLDVNEQIFLQQRERNRHLLMDYGETFLGLVRLNGQNQKVAQKE